MSRRKYHEIFNPFAKEVHGILCKNPFRSMIRGITKEVEDDEVIIRYLVLRYRKSLRFIIEQERNAWDNSKEKHLDHLIDDCIKKSDIDLDKSELM